ncbi:hypothetical protein DHT93_03425 [Streptococcus australis]|nr:hypothetical protein DHT93_03425 [Streptococcus australis]
MSSSLLENAKKPYNQGFSLLIHTKVSRLSPTNLHTQRFAVAVSFRRKLLTLRQLYPRAPSRPSVSPCRMGRTSASTSLMPQLVQAKIHTPHVVLANIYIIERYPNDIVIYRFENIVIVV